MYLFYLNDHPMQEAKLIQEIKRNDEKAFEEVYQRYHKPLYYLALKFVKNREMAEDVVQDVFVKFWHHREQLDESKSIKGFLFTATKNLVLNRIRDQKNQIIKQLEIFESQRMSGNDTEEKVRMNEMRRFMDKMAGKLSTRKREIFDLKVYKGLSNEEVATRLGLSINTVKFQYMQALKAIRTWLDAGKTYLILLISFFF